MRLPVILTFLIIALTFHYILFEHLDIVISIGSGVLVVVPDCVAYFVNNNTKLCAIFAYA